jgi:hypothetical protein
VGLTRLQLAADSWWEVRAQVVHAAAVLLKRAGPTDAAAAPLVALVSAQLTAPAPNVVKAGALGPHACVVFASLIAIAALDAAAPLLQPFAKLRRPFVAALLTLPTNDRDAVLWGPAPGAAAASASPAPGAGTPLITISAPKVRTSMCAQCNVLTCGRRTAG